MRGKRQEPWDSRDSRMGSQLGSEAELYKSNAAPGVHYYRTLFYKSTKIRDPPLSLLANPLSLNFYRSEWQFILSDKLC